MSPLKIPRIRACSSCRISPVRRNNSRTPCSSILMTAAMSLRPLSEVSRWDWRNDVPGTGLCCATSSGKMSTGGRAGFCLRSTAPAWRSPRLRVHQWPSRESPMLEKTRRPGRAGGLATAARRRSESLIRTLIDQRIAIEAVVPEIDCGRFRAKASTVEPFIVEADIFGEGHDRIAAALLYRKKGDSDFLEAAMLPVVNDRWRAE